MDIEQMFVGDGSEMRLRGAECAPMLYRRMKALEAQLRAQDEALRVARRTLRNIVECGTCPRCTDSANAALAAIEEAGRV